MGDPAILKGRIIHILCYHSTAIDDIPPPRLSLKQCFIRRSVNQKNIIGRWFHAIIKIKTLIPDKGNVLCPIGGVENAILNMVPWRRWWGGRIMDIWWRRVRLFVKEAFSWPLITERREPLVTMESLPGNGNGREENGFVRKTAACHLGLMCHTEISQSLHQQGVWKMRTEHCRQSQLLEDHITICSSDQTQPTLHQGRCEKNVWCVCVCVSNNEKLLYRNLWYNPT